MPYQLTVDKAEKVIKDIGHEVVKDTRVKSFMYKGVNNLSDSGIEYMIAVECEPKEKLQLKRDLLRVILVILNKNKIEIPYKQIDIHSK